MKWINSIWCLREKDHTLTRLSIREERVYYKVIFQYVSFVFISFVLVDCIAGRRDLWYFYLILRVSAVLISCVLFTVSRNRLPQPLRVFAGVALYVYTVQFLMFYENISFTPYFAGSGIVMLCITMLFPSKFSVAAGLNMSFILPALVWSCLLPGWTLSERILFQVMTLGTAIVCVVYTVTLRSDILRSYVLSEKLNRDLGKRGKEITDKANELLKRRVFESQFSPQVVDAVLGDRRLVGDTDLVNVAVIVIDISESTTKAHTIDPAAYREVVEVVMDVFSAACLKWDITLDKFTGDGVQAFAGAPIPQADDVNRALMACHDTIQMMRGRLPQLNRLWKDPLRVRFAISEGTALVGFIGKGIFKSYTAVGDIVSFAHRLVAIPKPWTIAFYSWNRESRPTIHRETYEQTVIPVNDLKGFDGRTFNVTLLNPINDEQIADVGRCGVCQTPMVVAENSMGMPRVYCAACERSNREAA